MAEELQSRDSTLKYIQFIYFICKRNQSFQTLDPMPTLESFFTKLNEFEEHQPHNHFKCWLHSIVTDWAKQIGSNNHFTFNDKPIAILLVQYVMNLVAQFRMPEKSKTLEEMQAIIDRNLGEQLFSDFQINGWNCLKPNGDATMTMRNFKTIFKN